MAGQIISSGHWSPGKALFVVVIGAALGWVAAIVSIYGILRGMDGDAVLSTAPTDIAAEDHYQPLADIAPAAGAPRNDGEAGGDANHGDQPDGN